MTELTPSGLYHFLEFTTEKGLINPNTAAGMRAACAKILEDVPTTQDLTGFDVRSAVIKYHNRHPGDLSPSSLRQYEKRAERAIEMYTQYQADPTSFKPASRVLNGTAKPDKGKSKRESKQPLVRSSVEEPEGARTHQQKVTGLITDTSLVIPFPLRPTFLAQVVVPRDLTNDEASRLCAFIKALGHDAPTSATADQE